MFLISWALAAEPLGHTHLGGYVEANAEWVKPVGGDIQGVARLRRAALALNQELGSVAEVEFELEVEDALVSSGSSGRVEVEEAELEWHLIGEALEARVGLLEIPFGWVNQHHEPYEFNGVQRPMVDQLLVPTTWRELGVGMGGVSGKWSYDLYATTSLDPTGFDDAGIANGTTMGSASPALAVAVIGRVERRIRKARIGVSAYASDAGGAGKWYDGGGESLHLTLPVLGVELDGALPLGPVTVKGEGVYWALPESDDLMEAKKADGSPYFPPGAGVVPTSMIGGYAEASFDLFSVLSTPGRLEFFARLEHYDTQFTVPDGYEANPARVVDEGTYGVTWGPDDHVAIKADVVLRDLKLGQDQLGWNLGVGWSF